MRFTSGPARRQTQWPLRWWRGHTMTATRRWQSAASGAPASSAKDPSAAASAASAASNAVPPPQSSAALAWELYRQLFNIVSYYPHATALAVTLVSSMSLVAWSTRRSQNALFASQQRISAEVERSIDEVSEKLGKLKSTWQDEIRAKDALLRRTEMQNVEQLRGLDRVFGALKACAVQPEAFPTSAATSASVAPPRYSIAVAPVPPVPPTIEDFPTARSLLQPNASNVSPPQVTAVETALVPQVDAPPIVVAQLERPADLVTTATTEPAVQPNIDDSTAAATSESTAALPTAAATPPPLLPLADELDVALDAEPSKEPPVEPPQPPSS